MREELRREAGGAKKGGAEAGDAEGTAGPEAELFLKIKGKKRVKLFIIVNNPKEIATALSGVYGAI